LGDVAVSHRPIPRIDGKEWQERRNTMKILKALNNIEEFFCAILIITMALLNFGNVVSRYFLHYSWSFTEEILMIMSLWCTLFATVVAFKRKQHLGLSIITERVSGNMKIVLIIISAAMSCILLWFFATAGISLIKTEILYKQTTPVLSIPEPIATVSIPICCILGIIRVITCAVKDTKDLLKGGKSV